MKKILIILVLIVGGVAGVLFTKVGQEKILLPLVNFYLSHKVPDHRIVLNKLEPGFASLKLAGSADGTIRFRAEGPVRWIGPRFDLLTRIDAKEVLLDGKRYPLELALKGSVKGEPSRLKIQGGGRAFGARLDYRFTLMEEGLRGIQVHAEGAKVDQLLALAGMPPYATGALDLSVDMPRLDAEHPEGSARLSVREGRLDPSALKREFGIELPKVERYRLDGAFRIVKGLIRGEAKLHTPLADLELEGFRSDSLLQIFKSRYRLSIPELSQLKSLTPIPLYGPWKMDGALYINRPKRVVQIQGESPSLEGRSAFFYDSGRLTLDFEKAGIPQLLALTGQAPLVATGHFSAKARLKDLGKKVSGSYRLKGAGAWDRVELAKLTGSDPGKLLDFSFQSEGLLKKGRLSATADYRNRLLDLRLPEIRYALANGVLDAKYLLKIPELSRIAALGKAGAKGEIEVSGAAHYLPLKKYLKIEGESPSFGGKSSFVYGGNRLKVSLEKVNGARLLRMAGQPPLLRASQVDGVLMLSDLQQRIGMFSLTASGSLDRQVLKKSFEIDPGPKLRLRLKGKGEIRGERVDAQWHLETPMAQLAVEHCRIRLDRGSCEGDYRLRIPELARLKSLTGRTYHGPLALAGKIGWDGRLHLAGSGNEWGGRIDYRLEGSLLRVKTVQLQAESLLKMLGYPALIKGTAASDLRMNLATQKGTLAAELSRARLLPGPLTTVASRMLRYDLSKEIFDKALFSSVIDGPKVLFDFDARSQRLRLSVKKGKIDRIKGTIDATVSIEDRGKLYRLQLRGPLARPRVIPLLTKDLAKKAEKLLKKKGLDKKIQKAIPKELRESGNPLGDFVKKLF